MSIPKDDWITKYLKFTENTEPPLLYKEWVACSVIAAVLQRKYKLTWGLLTFYPNLYVVLVGPSGKCRKGVSMSIGQKLLRELGIKMTAEAITREALIKDLSESTSTAEGGDGHQIIHSSLTIFSKELAVFLGQDNKMLMSDLTDWYDCDSKWEYRTKNSGQDEITGVWVNLIGATTPELVQSQLPRDAIGGGLSSRIIFVFEEKKDKNVAAPFLSAKQKALYTELVNELENMYGLSGEVKFDESFVEAYVKWYENSIILPPEYGGNESSAVRSDFEQGPLAYYNQRRANHVMSVAIILSASQKQKVLTDQILFRAIHLLERTEVKMPRTFGGYGEGARSELMFKLIEYISEVDEISRKILLDRVKYELDDVTQFDSLTQMLEQSGIIKIIHKQGKGTFFRIVADHPTVVSFTNQDQSSGT